MDNTGGWARNLDDGLRYLRIPAPYDADFASDEVPALIDDVEHLKRRGVDFTTDYRQIWQAIMGWDEWFRTFDDRELVFLFQKHLSNGRQSNFFHFDSPRREEA